VAALLFWGFSAIDYAGLETAVTTKTLQGSLIATGVMALFFSHIAINVGMVTDYCR
jgi:cell division protein FtsW (lipid II flippase)